jgi:hypothetical protein
MWLIMSLHKVETDSIFKNKYPNITISSPPVLIDPDYIEQDMEFFSQICITNVKDLANMNMMNEAFPDLIFEIKIFRPDFGCHHEYVYTKPLFQPMRPSDAEEFLEVNMFKQYVVPDFVFIKASKDAAGYDIMPRAIVDNCKDFDNDNLAEAVCQRITVPACYSTDILFPKFFNSVADQLDFANQFVLRSRVSKRNLSLEILVCSTNDLRVRLHNNNNFDLVLCEEQSLATEIPFRFMQFVPNEQMAAYMYDTDSDKCAKFLGAITIFNEKSRKAKF